MRTRKTIGLGGFPEGARIVAGWDLQDGHVFVREDDGAVVQPGGDVAGNAFFKESVDDFAPGPTRDPIDADLDGTNEGGANPNVRNGALIRLVGNEAVGLLDARPDGDALVFAVDPRFIRSHEDGGQRGNDRGDRP